MDERRYTRAEVAARFNANLVTLWRWEQAGCPMPARRLRTRGRPMLFTDADIKRIEKWRGGWTEVER